MVDGPITPRLLVSVRSVREADAALKGGADMIDIKEPDRGPLGMAAPSTIGAIVTHVAAARPVTAALGELHEHAAPPPRAATQAAHLDALRYVKLGLAHAPPHWRERLDAQAAAHTPARFIAAAYADHARVNAPPIDAVLAWAIERDAAGILIDTAIKDGRGLLHWCALDMLERCIAAAHCHGLLIALAGSLDAPAIEQLVPLAPDIIAVRSAACERADRGSSISTARIAQLKDLLPRTVQAAG